MKTPSLAARFLKNRDGAAAVEMAMVALPLTILIFGSVEYGRAHWTAQALQDTAVRAARCIGVRQSACSDKGAFDLHKSKAYTVETARGLGLSLDGTRVQIDPAATCGGRSGFVRVTLGYTFSSPLEGVLEKLGKGVTLGAEACFPSQPS